MTQGQKAKPQGRLISAASGAAAGLGKFASTVWRLAGALDSALWRGAKLGAGTIAGFTRATLTAAGRALGDVFQWLPSRAGRAYAAASMIVLSISALWIADEIRNVRSRSQPFDSIFRPPVDFNDPIVARIEGRFVHLSEITAYAKAAGKILEDENLTHASAFQRDLIKSYVEQRLLAKAAVESGVQRDPAVARRLAAARERILASSFMESRIAAAVTPERIKRVYQGQADLTRLGDEIKARHILVADEAEAHAILDEIANGGDFASIARARSLDRSTAPLGGEIGWFTKDMMAPTFAAAAFSTPKGAVAEPIATEFGWHVIEVLDRRSAQGVSYKSVEEGIRRFLTLREIETTIDGLKDDENVTIYPPEGEAR